MSSKGVLGSVLDCFIYDNDGTYMRSLVEMILIYSVVSGLQLV